MKNHRIDKLVTWINPGRFIVCLIAAVVIVMQRRSGLWWFSIPLFWTIVEIALIRALKKERVQTDKAQ